MASYTKPRRETMAGGCVGDHAAAAALELRRIAPMPATRSYIVSGLSRELNAPRARQRRWASRRS